MLSGFPQRTMELQDEEFIAGHLQTGDTVVIETGASEEDALSTEAVSVTTDNKAMQKMAERYPYA